VHVRLAKIDPTEMRELVLDAWRMVVPKRVAAAYEESIKTRSAYFADRTDDTISGNAKS
jgi:hypothetical protein